MDHAMDQSMTIQEKVAGIVIAAIIFVVIAAATLHH
jgi:hypothetical protein